MKRSSDSIFAKQHPGCLDGAFETLREFAARNERQQALRGPERHCRGSGTRALEANLAQVQFVGGEVGIGRVVLVKAAHLRIAKENAAAAIGLETMLVGVDHDGISCSDAGKGAGGVRAEIRRQFEIATVSRVYVHAEVVYGAQFEDSVERIDGSQGGCAQGDDDCAYVAGTERFFERVEDSCGRGRRRRRSGRAA